MTGISQSFSVCSPAVESEHLAELTLDAAVVEIERWAGDEVFAIVTAWAEDWLEHHPPHHHHHHHHHSIRLTLNVQGGHNMTTLTVDTTTGIASLQFTDDHGDPVAGPVDSVTGAPVVPVVVSDNDAAVTVAATSAGTEAGSFTVALTPVAVGTANLSVEALANSDGSPVLDAAGVALSLPAAVQVDITAGPVAGLTITVTA